MEEAKMREAAMVMKRGLYNSFFPKCIIPFGRERITVIFLHFFIVFVYRPHVLECN